MRVLTSLERPTFAPALSLACLLAAGVAWAEEERQHPARAATGRGRGAVEAADPARGDARRRHRRAPRRPRRHRRRGQPDQGHQERGRAGGAHRRDEATEGGGGRPRDRPRGPLRAARLRRPARAHGRLRAGHSGRVRAQALDGPRHHDQRRSRQRQRPRLHGRAQEEERAEPDHRARASSRT